MLPIVFYEISMNGCPEIYIISYEFIINVFEFYLGNVIILHCIVIEVKGINFNQSVIKWNVNSLYTKNIQFKG